MADAETYGDITYKGEKGMLVITDQVFHYTANGTSKTSVKCSWNRVEKRQLSPENSPVHMIKFVLISGKTAVFEVPNREALEELRRDAQSRMDLAKANASMRASTASRRSSEAGFTDPSTRSGRDWVDEPSDNGTVKRRASSTVQRRRSSTSGSPNGDACGWCCAGTLVCWLCTIIICILIALAAFLVYWFVIKDNEDDVLKTIGIDDSPTVDRNKPPDFGNEERYGIRGAYHEWDSEEVTLQYKLSDYIMDQSIDYRLYDGLDCRRSANDITGDGDWLFTRLILPNDGGADLTNEGRGSRDVDINIKLNRGEITDAPFFYSNGLEAGRLNFCIGLIINYNQIDYWSRVEEVNAVELAVQLDIDLSDFRRIEDATIQTIIRPQYNRRNLLRSREYPPLKARQDYVEEEDDKNIDFLEALDAAAVAAK